MKGKIPKGLHSFLSEPLITVDFAKKLNSLGSFKDNPKSRPIYLKSQNQKKSITIYVLGPEDTKLKF